MKQGELWGMGARDWAEYHEPVFAPLWDAALKAAKVRGGSLVLDAGCGTGGACLLAASRGAITCGIDASSEMIAVARSRMPRGEFRTCDMEHLPFPSNAFDAVIAVNSLQFADDPKAAAIELGRVSTSHGRVVLIVFDQPEVCDIRVLYDAVRNLAETPSESLRGPFRLSAPGELEAAINAPLKLDRIETVDVTFEYASLDHATRAFLSTGPNQRASQLYGAERVHDAVQGALTGFVREGGRVALQNRFRLAVCLHQ